MIEEMDVRMMDQQGQGQGRRTPVKVELRQKIQSRRRAQGQDDLSQEGLFREPERHELTPEEMERKERRRLQNRMAARRCREKKKKQQMYTREEFQQVSNERDKFKTIVTELVDLVHKHQILIPFPIPIKEEPDVQASSCAGSTFVPLPVKTEPGLEGHSCRQQGAQPPRVFSHDTELRTLLSPSMVDGLIPTSPFPPDDVFANDLSLPARESYRYLSDPLNAPGGSPEGALWGRDLPSTSDSDYAAATPQSCVPPSPAEGACCPSPDLPCTQGSLGFDLHASSTSPGQGSPEGLGFGVSGPCEQSFYPATPDTAHDDLCFDATDELAVETYNYIKGFFGHDVEESDQQELLTVMTSM